MPWPMRFGRSRGSRRSGWSPRNSRRAPRRRSSAVRRPSRSRAVSASNSAAQVSTDLKAGCRPAASRSARVIPACSSEKPRYLRRAGRPRSRPTRPRQAPRIGPGTTGGRPARAWARMGSASPSRSMALVIVVLSPPGMMSASSLDSPRGASPRRPLRQATEGSLRGQRSRPGSPARPREGAPPSQAYRLAPSPAGSRPALLQELSVRSQLGDVVSPHGLAKLH